MGVFERKIFKPKKNKEDKFEKRIYDELGRLHGKVSIIGVMKSSKMNQNKIDWICLEIKRDTGEGGT